MSISDIELYHCPLTRSARVKWLLHELVDDDFTVHRLDLYNMDGYHPDYLQMNPNHNVPLIRFRMADGSLVTIAESGVFFFVLADAFPERLLAPPPAPMSPERIDYQQPL